MTLSKKTQVLSFEPSFYERRAPEPLALLQDSRSVRYFVYHLIQENNRNAGKLKHGQSIKRNSKLRSGQGKNGMEF